MELLTASEGIRSIKTLYPELSACLAPVSNSQKLQFVKLSYLYGESIVKEGRFQLPGAISNQHSLSSLGLDYCDIPLAMVLTKGCEVSLSDDQRSMPLNLVNPGQLFGLFETIDWLIENPKRVIWRVTAGCRSTFMLPSVHDVIAHQRLQSAFDLTVETPQNLLEHASLFHELNAKAQQPWQCDVLLFPRDWFLDSTIRDSLFRLIVTLGWKRTQYVGDHGIVDQLNESFSSVMKKRRIVIPPGIIEKIKHFLVLSSGSLPGFGPALDDTFLPLSTIQKAYREVYQLKRYAPLVVQPQFLKPNAPIYYFLNFPYSTSIYKSGIKSLLGELKYIKTTLHYFLLELRKSVNAGLFKNSERVDYQFFHRGVETAEILSAASMPDYDPRWMVHDTGEEFPNHAPALSGCIQIGVTKQEI